MTEGRNARACFDSVDDVLVDGANGVCARPSVLHPGFGVTSLAVSAIVIAATIVLFGRPRQGRRVWAIAAMVLIGAVPGLNAVWRTRPDAPAHLPATAATVERFTEQVDLFAREHGECVEVDANGCEACGAVLFYVRPASVHCRGALARVKLDDGALEAGCKERGNTLTCGGGRP